MNKKLVKKMEKMLVGVAKKSAKLEANSTCAFWSYQAKEPVDVKRLRKF